RKGAVPTPAGTAPPRYAACAVRISTIETIWLGVSQVVMFWATVSIFTSDVGSAQQAATSFAHDGVVIFDPSESVMVVGMRPLSGARARSAIGRPRTRQPT